MLHDMLGKKDIMATIAVKDMDKARAFYEGKLGLKQVDPSDGEVSTYEAGHTNLIVYKSKFAGGYGATVATWDIGDDIENLVDELKSRGIEFEHYDDMPGTDIKGDIHMAGDMKVAWFKDPDGSIICLVSGGKTH